MQSVHRSFGKLLTRSADESQVSILLKDFEDADRMLTKVSISTFFPMLGMPSQADTVTACRCLQGMEGLLDVHLRYPTPVN